MAEFREELRSELQTWLDALNTVAFLMELSRSRHQRVRLHGRLKVRVTLYNGDKITLLSPCVRVTKKRQPGRPPKRGKSKLIHVGLIALGFIQYKSPGLMSKVARSAVSSTSFDTARQALALDGIRISADSVRKWTLLYADKFIGNRQQAVLDGAEKQMGLRLHICVDGGRIRLREKWKGKNGVRKKGSFEGNWREPKVIVIYCLNSKGELLRQLRPVYDGTMGNWLQAFELLQQWLTHYNLADAERITFCADGGLAIWDKVKPMFERLGVRSYKEVVDYTHAKQNMQEVIDKINAYSLFHKSEITEKVRDLLWKGDIKGIRELARERLGTRKRAWKQVNKKLDGYFGCSERFQYQQLKKQGHDIGSGVVESAIRRVINLRLKSAGSFWHKDNCERILYLRGQLLSGRWKMLDHHLEKNRHMLLRYKDFNRSEETLCLAV